MRYSARTPLARSVEAARCRLQPPIGYPWPNGSGSLPCAVNAADNRNRVDRGMNFREPRVAIGAIWGLVGTFAVVQAMSWTTHGIPGGIPWSRAAVIQAVAAWAVILILAVLSTQRVLHSTREIT